VRARIGWAAVLFSTAIACFWAFWGILENFHEGWYGRNLAANLAGLFGQYLLPSILFVAGGLLALYLPRIGAALHAAAAGGAAWHFRGAAPVVVHVSIVLPLLLLAAAYGVGRVGRRRVAAALLAGLPLATTLGFGIGPALRVAGRLDDGDRGARRVTANGVDLVFAPKGPGWPDDGVPFEEAKRICRHLNEAGTALEPEPRDLWRLPTAEEAVRAQTRRGANAGGSWDAVRRRATYRVTPDKETPLWEPRSKVIYWWTATEASARDAFIVVYNGRVEPRPKVARWGYLAFRAVRTPGPS